MYFQIWSQSDDFSGWLFLIARCSLRRYFERISDSGFRNSGKNGDFSKISNSVSWHHHTTINEKPMIIVAEQAPSQMSFVSGEVKVYKILIVRF